MSYSKNELIIASSGYEDDEIESDLDEDLEESDEDPKDEFIRETEGLFADSFGPQKKPPNFFKNMILEIKSLKLTFNQENNAVIEALIPMILNSVKPKNDQVSDAQFDEDIKKVICEWKYLLKEFSSDSEDQNYLIEECEIHCSVEKEFQNKFLVILKCLHKNIINSKKI